MEDDLEIAKVIRDHFNRKGYVVTWASTGQEGLEDFQAGLYDVVIVDLMLPEMDGFTLIQHLRWDSDVPVIILSAKHGEDSKVDGLKLGADDYLTKPFSLRELEARVESQRRRYKRYQRQDSVGDKWEYEGMLTIFPDKQLVQLGGEEIVFTSKEYALLYTLASQPNRAFTKKELYEHVWKQTDINGNNTITVHIKGLRQKLRDTTRNPKFIQTVWGTGYRFIGVKK